MPKRSTAATLAATIGVIATSAVLLGLVGIQLGVLSPFVGFRVFGLGIAPGSLLALLLGGVGLWRTRASTGREGRERAWLGTGLGVALFVVLAGSIGPGYDKPAIHDVTTNIADPPAFSRALRKQREDMNGVDYPDGGPGVPDAQRAAYPDLAPIAIPVPPEQAFARSRRAADELGWTITLADPATGRLEAHDTSRIFRFVDDVAIRIKPRGTGSLVDVRSSSRVGRGDIGANAARIAAFRQALLTLD